jgi:hypothetical protein
MKIPSSAIVKPNALPFQYARSNEPELFGLVVTQSFRCSTSSSISKSWCRLDICIKLVQKFQSAELDQSPMRLKSNC